MEYSIEELARLSGVSSRTLRYYHQQGLLLPQRVGANGYRYYGPKEVDCLQQILFFKRMGFSLAQIKVALAADNFDFVAVLGQQKVQLEAQREVLNQMLATVEQTIRYYKGEEKMTDEAKFAAFKEQQIADNEKKFGAEIRAKYGETTIDESNAKLRGMSLATYQEMQATEGKLMEQLQKFVAEDLAVTSEVAEEIYQLHRQWLTYSWPDYSLAAHQGLVAMYLSDERFQKYYDRFGAGLTQALVDIVLSR